MEKPKDLMLARELAKKLRMAISTIYAKAKRGEIPGAERYGRSIRFRREAFEEPPKAEKKA